MYRLLTHQHLHGVTKHEVETHWCLDDVYEAHDVLDAIDEHLAIEAAKNGG